MLRKTLILGICFVTLIGCSTPTPSNPDTQTQIIISNIKQLEQQSAVLSQKMIGRQQNISNLELQKSKIEADLRAYNQKIEAFKVQHKDVIGCRNAVRAGQDKSERYSENEKNVANAVTFFCGAGFLADEEFRNKVLFVNEQLSQADSNINNFKSNFQAIQSQIDSENELLAQEQSQARELATSIQEQQSQLE
jgi:hypothetical protein